jgi:hypothetical protein
MSTDLATSPTMCFKLRLGFSMGHSGNFGNDESVTRHGNVPSDDMETDHKDQALVD